MRAEVIITACVMMFFGSILAVESILFGWLLGIVGMIFFGFDWNDSCYSNRNNNFAWN